MNCQPNKKQTKNTKFKKKESGLLNSSDFIQSNCIIIFVTKTNILLQNTSTSYLPLCKVNSHLSCSIYRYTFRPINNLLNLSISLTVYPLTVSSQFFSICYFSYVLHVFTISLYFCQYISYLPFSIYCSRLVHSSPYLFFKFQNHFVGYDFLLISILVICAIRIFKFNMYA